MPQSHHPQHPQHPQQNGPPPRPAHVQHFITMALSAAQSVSRKYGIPVSVVLAQSALESGWGQQVKGNAYFGVKGTGGTAGGVTFGTTEFDKSGKKLSTADTFRAFTSYAEAAEDYGKLLSTKANYKAAFAHKTDPLRFAEEIAKGGYATDPDYAKKVKATITSQRLTEYDLP
jgi:flagellum-specific peptidoglycan hydrolase FlgJ